MDERRINHQRRETFERLRDDLFCRLSGTAQDLEPSELIELTSRMIRLELKFDEVSAVPGKRKCSDLRSARSQPGPS